MRGEIKILSNRRLAKVAGQIGGIHRMIEDGRDCLEVLTQISAARSALDQFGVLLLSEHLESCVFADTHTQSEEQIWLTQEARLEEIRNTLDRFLPVFLPPLAVSAEVVPEDDSSSI